MKILAVGVDADFPADGYGDAAHGSHVRLLCTVRALARLGHDVHLVGRSDGGTAISTLRLVTPEGVVCNSYDSVLIVGLAGLRRLEGLGIRDAALAHPNITLILDALYPPPYDPGSLGFARVVALANSNAAAKHMRLSPGQTVVYSPWCCAPDIPDLPNPWPIAGDRVIFTGIVHTRYEGLLNRLAELSTGRYEVWLAGLFAGPIYFEGLTEQQRRERLHPSIRLGTDIFPRVAGGMTNGPVRYLDVCAMAQHANVGINLTPDAVYPYGGVSCKVYDYLAAGLRVVTEPNAATDGDLVAVRGGTVVDWHNPEAVHVAILSDLSRTYYRSELRQRALARFSFADQARLLASHMGCT